MAQLVWHGPQVLKAINRSIDRGLETGAAFLASDIQSSFPQGVQPGAALGQAVRTQAASPPGTPPFTKTNRLRGSITWERRGEARYAVGTNVKYGRLHETGGTVTRKPRPYMVMPDASGRPRARWLTAATAARRRSQGKPVKYTKPTATYPKRPFMRPSLDRNKTRVVQLVRNSARRELGRRIDVGVRGVVR